MDKSLLIRKLVEKVVETLKTSSTKGSDADWYIGFGDDVNTANEEEMRDDGKGLAKIVMQQVTPIKS